VNSIKKPCAEGGLRIKDMKKVAFYTLGCKVNQYETDSMKSIFEKDGFIVVEFNEVADIYVINTCTVTAMGDKKSRQIIHGAKKNNEQAIVVVTGCMAQASKKEDVAIDGADIIIGNEDRKNVLTIVKSYNGNKLVSVGDINKERKFWELDGTVSEERTRAYIKIQDGCDRYCSYCIIPYVRGPVRSRNPEDVIKEVKRMVQKGFSEIVLIGIHLASYGKELKTITLIDILEELNKIEELKRIRLGSLEPLFINENVIERLKKLDKVCKHFHLSLQSGCDETLKRMNRRYTTAEYEKRVDMIRNAFPDAAITTDVITGFPGETEEEFNQTYEFLTRIKLSKMHVFPYSIRKGTAAEKMNGQIEKNVKKERAEKLIELSLKNEIEFAKRFVGKDVEVILEKGQTGVYREGYTKEYVKVFFEGGEAGEEIHVTGDTVNDEGILIVRKASK